MSVRGSTPTLNGVPPTGIVAETQSLAAGPAECPAWYPAVRPAAYRSPGIDRASNGATTSAWNCRASSRPVGAAGRLTR